MTEESSQALLIKVVLLFIVQEQPLWSSPGASGQQSVAETDEELEASIMEELEREEETKHSQQAALQRKLLAEQDQQRKQEIQRFSLNMSDDEADALAASFHSPRTSAANLKSASPENGEARHAPLSRKPALGDGSSAVQRRRASDGEATRQRRLEELAKIQASAAQVREMWKAQDAAQKQTQAPSYSMSLPRRATIATFQADGMGVGRRPLSMGGVPSEYGGHHPLSYTFSSPLTHKTAQIGSSSSSASSSTRSSPRVAKRQDSMPARLSPVISRYEHSRIEEEHKQRQSELQRLKEERRRSELTYLETERQIQDEVGGVVVWTMCTHSR